MLAYGAYVASSVCLMAGKALSGSECAPPAGSGMMVSMTPNLTSSGAVMRSASVACGHRRTFDLM